LRESISLVPKIIYVPPREIVRLGKRWIVYLPQEYEELWETIKRCGKKVKLYIEVIES